MVFLFAADPDQLTFINFVGATATPQSLLLPVLGILAVTAEWSQRTGLVTFTLEPNRARTAVAKLTAVVLIGLLAVVAALGVAALGNAAGMLFMDGAGTWNMGRANVRDFFLLQLIGLVQGFAIGMLLMNTAAAIVLYYVLPIAWSVLFTMVSALEGVAPWLDLNTAIAPGLRPADLPGRRLAAHRGRRHDLGAGPVRPRPGAAAPARGEVHLTSRVGVRPPGPGERFPGHGGATRLRLNLELVE